MGTVKIRHITHAKEYATVALCADEPIELVGRLWDHDRTNPGQVVKKRLRFSPCLIDGYVATLDYYYHIGGAVLSDGNRIYDLASPENMAVAGESVVAQLEAIGDSVVCGRYE